MEDKLKSNLLFPYFESGYPVVAVETYEERRLIEESCSVWESNEILSIAASGGLRSERQKKITDKSANFTKAFEHIASCRETILFVSDFQHMVNSAVAYRCLLNSLASCKSNGSMIVLIAPAWNLPAELKHEIPVLQMSLPTEEELEVSLDLILKEIKTKPKDLAREELLSAGRGLTLTEAENVYALSSQDEFSPLLVEREKMRLVRSAYMSVEKPSGPESLAGLSQLKAYIREEVLPSKDDPLLRVMGILLVGVPGTGKSLSSKVIASILRWPLVRFDISAAKGSLVGQSESNIRSALATADAISPCVLWLDEIEKAVGGHASSAMTDSGTTLAMVGTLLTWMQEHKSPVIVVATCNDFSKLPAELTRAGRFDEKFFLDLPILSERKAIAKIHLSRLGCEDNWDESIAEMTNDWTGAEIEQLIKSSARRTSKKIDLQALNYSASQIIPISKIQSIQSLREWAQNNLRKANDVEESVVKSTRKMKNAVN